MRRLLLAALLTSGIILTVATPVSAQDEQAPPVIKVLEPGAEPRAQLRYVVVPGAEQQSILKVDTRISQKVNDDDPRSGRSPQIEFDVRTTIGEPTQEALTINLTFDDLRVAEGAGQSELEDALEPLVGFEAALTMTNRGEIIATDAAIPTDLDETTSMLLDQFLQQARALTVPLPEEAVGDGARWSARSEVTVSGITLRQTARYEVTSLTAEGVELSVEITQRASRQTFTDPASGTEVELLSSRGTGDGKSKIAFASALPIDSDTHVQVKQKLRAQGDRISQTVTANAFFEDA